MSKHNPSTTLDLFQDSGLANAMHNACIATLRCYVKDSESPSGLSEATLFGFEVAGATMYVRVIQKLGLIVTSTECEMAMAQHTPNQAVFNIRTAIVLALSHVGVTDELLKELDFVQASHEKLWSASDADLELLPFLRNSALDNPSGLTLDSEIKLQPWLYTLDVYWQTAGSASQIYLPTLIRDVRRERKEHGKSLHRVIATTGGMYSRIDDTLHAAPRPSGLYTRSVRCVVDGASYVAYRKGDRCKMLHLGDKPRSIGKATTEGLGVILSAMWGVDSSVFAGTTYRKVDYLVHHYAPALLVMTLTDATGADWIVVKHREYWAASRMAAKSRTTVVKIYT